MVVKYGALSFCRRVEIGLQNRPSTTRRPRGVNFAGQGDRILCAWLKNRTVKRIAGIGSTAKAAARKAPATAVKKKGSQRQLQPLLKFFRAYVVKIEAYQFAI